MAKGDKYLALMNYLMGKREKEIELTFDEIEKIVGFELPDSHKKNDKAWWSNDKTHSQAIAWLNAGYETSNVSETLKKEIIRFIKK